MENFGAEIAANQLPTVVTDITVVIVFTFEQFDVLWLIHPGRFGRLRGFGHSFVRSHVVFQYGFVGLLAAMALPPSGGATSRLGLHGWIMAMDMKVSIACLALNILFLRRSGNVGTIFVAHFAFGRWFYYLDSGQLFLFWQDRKEESFSRIALHAEPIVVRELFDLGEVAIRMESTVAP